MSGPHPCQSDRVRFLVGAVPLLLLAAACSAGPAPNAAPTSAPTSAPSAAPAPASGAGQAAVAPGTIRVSSPDFSPGGVLPTRFTCAGARDTPALRWSGVPAGTRALAVTVTDTDAPRGTFTHWVVFDLPASATALGTVPPGARQGTNSAHTHGYTAPCPPSGTHHYHFTVAALRAPLAAPDGAPYTEVAAEVARQRIADGEVVATVTQQG
jgi:Raf kinase inhibitor-like YbhB/YbcL family protein